MLHYAQDVKGPITTLHMLGVILPILGLVIFPIIGSLLQGFVKWYHLAILYNIILPLLVFALGMNILTKRPTGYGDSKIADRVYHRAYDPFWICSFKYICRTNQSVPYVSASCFCYIYPFYYIFNLCNAISRH